MDRRKQDTTQKNHEEILGGEEGKNPACQLTSSLISQLKHSFSGHNEKERRTIRAKLQKAYKLTWN